MIVRAMTPRDWGEVARIYAEGIATGDATFETAVPTWDAWDGAHNADCRLIAEDGATVAGWAALAPISRRAVYRGVAEVSVYVAALARGHGVGRTLIGALLDAADAAGYWTLQAGIFPENEVSLALHRAVGFREIGRRERIGAMADGRWRDVLLLERRRP
jgi:phosphinothricin acetyltransferase